MARNEMLVRLVGLVHFCATSYVALKIANCVKIKMNEKVTRLKSSTLTVGNLAIIFNWIWSKGSTFVVKKNERSSYLQKQGFSTWKTTPRRTS